MKKIFSLLKKSVLKILLIILLLYVQVRCDLMLPEYTSDIINVGIQQGGITEYIPKVIRTETLEKIILFSNTEETELINNSYQVLNINDKEYIDEYPILKEESIAVLDEEKYEDIEAVIQLYFITVKAIEKDDSIIKNNPNLFEDLKYMDNETKNLVIEKITEKFSSYDDSIINQMSIAFTKSEYETIGINIEATQTRYIVTVGLKMVGVSLFAMLLAVIVAYLSAQVAASFAKDLRKNVVNKVMSFTNKEYKEFSTASLITRSTNDIQQIQLVIVMALRILIYAPVLGIGAFLKVINDEMSWVIALALGVIFFIVILLFMVVMPKFKLIQKLIDKLNLVSREIITGIPVIRAFATHKQEEQKFDEANVSLTKTNLFVNKVMSTMMPLMMFIMNGVSILILWVGADRIDAGSMQIGTLMAFITYTMQIIMAFLMITMISIILPRASVSLKRINEIIQKEICLKDPLKPEKYDNKVKGLVEFKDVYFRYHDAEEDVLEDISFTAEPGTTTAIIGSTGSGKSTLINLIPRFFDVTGGKILVDGIDVKAVKQKDLRDRIGFVPQKGHLFYGTIESNIKFGADDISEQEVKNAAKIAQATEFIDSKKEKYGTEVSQDGTNLSGGQRQRLAIARAIAKNPEIYIFDDSFSALDYKTDIKLRQALSKTTDKSTIIIVAQRISTILNADKIIVLDQGKVVGIGNHETLMNNCSVYQEIALSQLSKEELSNA